ncbi:hypothetical protein GCM10025760_33270 [Microbacterium yannicii]|uniref:Uncharacterized protein n=1 Tax=Microbacterium yannicii TaxID=671622 RepID=A0ABP9MKU7_9MICO
MHVVKVRGIQELNRDSPIAAEHRTAGEANRHRSVTGAGFFHCPRKTHAGLPNHEVRRQSDVCGPLTTVKGHSDAEWVEERDHDEELLTYDLLHISSVPDQSRKVVR